MWDDFFSFAEFAHEKIWKREEPIWAPLHSLKQYLEKFHAYSIEIKIPSGVFLENPHLIAIGAGTIIEPGTYIKGPCIIGKNCQISHGAYIREHVLCGDGCMIGHAAEIKHSILLNGAVAAHFTYVGDSILGNRVNLGAGVKCANLRLDKKPVTVLWEGRKTQTELKKMGAIIGDGVQIGCNAVLNPGTIIGRDAIVFPLMNIHGFYPPFTQITPKGTKIIEKLICQSKNTAVV